MTFEENTPTVSNKNYLPETGFKLVLKRAPALVYFLQKAPIPAIDLGVCKSPNPFYKYSIPGDHLTFGDLTLTFKCDEDMTNYLEIFAWMIGLGKPDTFEEYAELASHSIISGKGITSDIMVLINDSRKNVNIQVTYRDAFPYHLSELVFDSTVEDISFVWAEVSFTHSGFLVERL